MTVTHTTWSTTPLPSRPSEPIPRPADAMMTIHDVAAACKLSETAVRRAISEGELTAVKLRSRLRITRADFDAWITSQRQTQARGTTPPRPVKPPRRAPAGSFRSLVQADVSKARTQ
jgi:excisionase family DNA binding protein